ncbi:PHP domain-containing protein [uncultured Pseudoteredinibacter sp.]|uniref:PHP domain-containing protein n=1 Tax=uncultured Pseudoteredinibacter sp. TaxID=1641701 RepID=UPI00262D736D|nr:PHP domain-containing protein [uncultured Pseudoteredinibacter sp.]
MSKIYDLHSHSDYSDGILSPSELVSRAYEQSVNVLALTDHDTLAGIAQAQAAASSCGLDLIPGIEFSCQWNGRGIHIVGLNIDTGNEQLLSAVEEQRQRRELRTETIAKKLHKVGIEGSLHWVQQKAGKGTIGRPHFAQFLVEKGHVRTINLAFKKYLGAGKPGDVKNLWPNIEDVCGWIRAAGGHAVLAHPDKYKLTRTKLRELCADFKEAGGAAIEIVSGKQQANVTQNIMGLAKEFDLLGSLGSDFHQPHQPWQELACCGVLPEGVKPVWQNWG